VLLKVTQHDPDLVRRALDGRPYHEECRDDRR
jgi:hypothetical protein